MEAVTILFSVKENNNLYKLELSKALLNMVEFDFTFFWEKCIDAGRTAKKTGRLPADAIAGVRSIIADFHPYTAALINSDFHDIVTDCIIEYICQSEKITADELWLRCISPKNMYEETIFKRISEYKTGRASNQWNNIVRIQEYAKNKILFIYDTDEPGTPLSTETIRARKQYFDMAFSVAANELGVQGSMLPSARVSSPALTPNSVFINSKAAKVVYRRFEEVLRMADDMSMPDSKDCTAMRDDLAMNAYFYVKGMKRPDDDDIKYAVDSLKNAVYEVYIPDSFKAVVDMEFDLMEKHGIVLRKCEGCGRYFAAVDDGFFCDRVNSSGTTCLDHANALKKAVADASEKASEQHNAANMSEKGENVPDELEKRGRKIYKELSGKVGKEMDENELREWSRYLSDMKRNIELGEAAVEQLEEFLDYSDKFCDEVKNVKKADISSSTARSYIKINRPNVRMADEDPEMSHIHVPLKAEPEVISTVQGVTKIVSADEINIRPFVPETFESIQEASAFVESTAVKNTAPPVSEEPAPQKKSGEIKAFEWKRMTREEAYSMNSFDDDDE